MSLKAQRGILHEGLEAFACLCTSLLSFHVRRDDDDYGLTIGETPCPDCDCGCAPLRFLDYHLALLKRSESVSDTRSPPLIAYYLPRVLYLACLASPLLSTLFIAFICAGFLAT